MRAKKTLAAAKVPFEVPEPQEYAERLGSVLSVLYLIFNEGYLPASGEQWVRPDVSAEALRLARMVAGLMPREPEAQSLVALMEFTRVAIPGADRPRRHADPARPSRTASRWDRAQIDRGRAALARADRIGRGRAAYGLQAAIAECHAVAPSVEDTDWARIVLLYEALGRIAPSPVVELNRAVAVAMSTGPASALRIVDELERGGTARGLPPACPRCAASCSRRLGRTERGARRARDRRAADRQRARTRRAAREDRRAPSRRRVASGRRPLRLRCASEPSRCVGSRSTSRCSARLSEVPSGRRREVASGARRRLGDGAAVALSHPRSAGAPSRPPRRDARARPRRGRTAPAARRA